MYTDKDPSDGKVSAQHIRDSLKLPQLRHRGQDRAKDQSRERSAEGSARKCSVA